MRAVIRGLDTDSWPRLKATDLQRIAFLCGWKQSGTRAAVAEVIRKGAETWTSVREDARILSLDMGLRNLAYSLLTPGVGDDVPARLHAWDRVALVPPEAEEEGDDDFSPARLSGLAVSFVRDRILPLRPTHVLIERQRYRTGGGAAVHEWTVRVNAFEAMLYAVLAQLRADGRWHGGEAVVPVSPQRVAAMGAYLLAVERSRRRGGATAPTAREADAAEAEKRTKPTDAVKKEKTALVALMLQHGDEFRVEAGQPAAMAQSFLQRWRLQEDRRLGVARAGRRAAKSHGTPVVKKLDDLADSLLQGVAWLRWEVNRRTLHNYGPHALLAANDAVEPDPAAEKET